MVASETTTGTDGICFLISVDKGGAICYFEVYTSYTQAAIQAVRSGASTAVVYSYSRSSAPTYRYSSSTAVYQVRSKDVKNQRSVCARLFHAMRQYVYVALPGEAIQRCTVASGEETATSIASECSFFEYFPVRILYVL